MPLSSLGKDVVTGWSISVPYLKYTKMYLNRARQAQKRETNITLKCRQKIDTNGAATLEVLETNVKRL